MNGRRIAVPILIVVGAVALLCAHHLQAWPFASAAPAPETADHAEPATEEAPAAAGHIKLTAEQIKNAQIQTQAVSSSSFTPQLMLTATIQEDPDATFVIRAPFSGTIRAASDVPWPKFGDLLSANRQIGSVEPRLAPSDQIAVATQRSTLQTQAAAAQSDLAGATASLDAARKAYDRLKTLNATDKNVSDRAVEEAETKVKSEEAHLTGAQSALQLSNQALDRLDPKLSSISLTIPQDGQVLEINAHPGESIEPGQPILRVGQPRQLLVAVNSSSSELGAQPLKVAHVSIPGRAETLEAGLIPNAPAVIDPKTREQSILFRLSIPAEITPPAPGSAVAAAVELGGQPLNGFTIPRSAITRYQGKAWVYTTADEKDAFDRREVSLDHPLPDGSGWFVNEGFKGDEQVVTTGAGALLSSELIAVGG